MILDSNQTLSRYRADLLKVSKPRLHSAIHSFGINDIIKVCFKDSHYLGVKNQTLFRKIVASIHKGIVNAVLLGNSVLLPYKMGAIEVRKQELKPSFKNGKLQIPYPIDWLKTIQLWYEDEEAAKNKVLIRILNKWNFKVLYNKGNAYYKNKSRVRFKTNRLFKLALKELVLKGFDAYMLYGDTVCKY